MFFIIFKQRARLIVIYIIIIIMYIFVHNQNIIYYLLYQFIIYQDNTHSYIHKMLNNLLKALKSQKSSKSNIQNNHPKHKEPIADPSSLAIQSYTINPQTFEQMNTNVIQTCKNTQKIRYLVLPNLPNIFNKVLGCPISVFHFLPHGMRKVKQIDLNIDKYPQYLDCLKPLLQKQLPDYNHLLINHYIPGIGIMPHTDGPAYKSKVFVLSLNSYTIINFQESCTSSQQHTEFPIRLLLQPNSIHIFEQEAYTKYLHGIQNYPIDSILVKYDQQQRKVVKSNINNYGYLGCRKQIEGAIELDKEEEYVGEGFRIARIQGNQQYTHKIEIQRKQRISITIRNKLS